MHALMDRFVHGCLDIHGISLSGVKTTPSPVEENVLGRPLTLKSPVISTRKQPTSLGDFLSKYILFFIIFVLYKRYFYMLETKNRNELNRSARGAVLDL